MTDDERLSPDEQLVLARRYRRTHDRLLEDRLLRSQLRLVAKLARQLGRDRDRDDLIQEGSLGVLQAIRHFDPARGVRLSTYAAWWIRAYQLRWLVANHRLVRVGKTVLQRRVFFEGRALRRRLITAGLDAAPDQLARRLGVDAGRFARDLSCIDAREVDIDASLPQPDDGVEERLGAAETKKVVADEVRRFVASLRGRSRTIVRDRWLEEQPLTLREMGRRLGVSRERVRQLEGRLLKELRERLPADVAA
jgi:RNA polymerase sigma-32 factor